VDFQQVLQPHTAGSPVEQHVVWTDLTTAQIAQQITQRGNPVSVHIVEQLLQENGYHRRKAQKVLPMAQHQDRNQQFEIIAQLNEQYIQAALPVLSIDTKKRELIGNFYRAGRLWSTETIKTFDHDFPSFATGVVIPHGIYDDRLKRGYIRLGTSHDTSEFACAGIRDWWERYGQYQYAGAKKLLLLCDGGGSNSAGTYLFKADLQRW
jgi:hypothetical protein